MASRPGTLGDALRVTCRRADVEDVDAVLSVVSDDPSGYRQRFATFDVQALVESRCGVFCCMRGVLFLFLCSAVCVYTTRVCVCVCAAWTCRVFVLCCVGNCGSGCHRDVRSATIYLFFVCFLFCCACRPAGPCVTLVVRHTQPLLVLTHTHTHTHPLSSVCSPFCVR